MPGNGFGIYLGAYLLLLVPRLYAKSFAEPIAGLPGQPAIVSFKQYSGYIVTDDQHGRALFYYFVEAETAHPFSLPLTLWLNGGPACSSLGFGAFMENGPFQPGEDGILVKNQSSCNSGRRMVTVIWWIEEREEPDIAYLCNS